MPGTEKVGAPKTLTVPLTDADGAYSVSWAGVSVPGVSYVLEEATDTNFSAGLRIAYFGSALSKNIVGRAPGTTYYYRIKTVKPGVEDSARRVADNGCTVGP